MFLEKTNKSKRVHQIQKIAPIYDCQWRLRVSSENAKNTPFKKKRTKRFPVLTNTCIIEGKQKSSLDIVQHHPTV